MHLWNTWIDNESSQIEEVDLGAMIYIFFTLLFFLWVCMCMLLCVILSVELSFTLCPRVLSVSFWFFFYLKNFFFFKIIFYFNNFILLYFTLLYFIFLSFFLFFLPFILSHVEDRLLVLQPGVRVVPLRWESQVQDTGPQENSQLHVISNGKNLLEISIWTPKSSSTHWPASYSAGHPMPNN